MFYALTWDTKLMVSNIFFPFDPHGHSSDSLMSFSSTKTQVQIFYCLASHKTLKDLNEKNNSIPEESVSSQEIRFSSLYSSN